MLTNTDAIAGLDASKKTLNSQCNAASGTALTDLMTSIQNISDEVGALEVLVLASSYIPQTDAFKAVTDAAKSFVITLNRIKAAFGAVDEVAQAINKILSYIK